MFVVGLTGGAGAGKSTVAKMLARRGAVVIDADVLAREVVAPGTLGHAAVSARFGRAYLLPDGTVDRAGLADLVFSDDDARHDLEGIVHPLVREQVEGRLADLRSTDSVVLLVVPLLIESGRYTYDRLVVVDAEEEVSTARMIEGRGWTERQARRRLAAQAGRAERRAAADLVIDNSGSLDALIEQVDATWRWMGAEAEHAAISSSTP